MSAEELGKRLRGEIEDGTLSEILKALKTGHSGPNAPVVGLPAVDSLFHAHNARNPQVSRAGAPGTEPFRASRQPDGIRPTVSPPVLEITAEELGAGKTHLLYMIATIGALPKDHRGINLDGRASAVVYLDTDARFDVDRLVEVMRHYITTRAREEASKEPDSDEPAELSEDVVLNIIRAALQHIHIFRPHSFPSLLSTLHHLPTYLFSRGEQHSSTRPLHCIILDSATSFYWQYRAEQDRARIAILDAPARAAPASTIQEPAAPYEALVRQLRAIGQRFACAVVATTAPLGGYARPVAATPQARWSPRPQLPHPWPAFVTLKLLVGRQPVPRFAPAISVDEALAERGDRQGVVERALFSARTVGGTSDGKFTFMITERGVDFDE